MQLLIQDLTGRDHLEWYSLSAIWCANFWINFTWTLLHKCSIRGTKYADLRGNHIIWSSNLSFITIQAIKTSKNKFYFKEPSWHQYYRTLKIFWQKLKDILAEELIWNHISRNFHSKNKKAKIRFLNSEAHSIGLRKKVD